MSFASLASSRGPPAAFWGPRETSRRHLQRFVEPRGQRREQLCPSCRLHAARLRSSWSSLGPPLGP
eukprot:6464008-Pyramimonas_sp.AAC.1